MIDIESIPVGSLFVSKNKYDRGVLLERETGQGATIMWLHNSGRPHNMDNLTYLQLFYDAPDVWQSPFYPYSVYLVREHQ